MSDSFANRVIAAMATADVPSLDFYELDVCAQALCKNRYVATCERHVEEIEVALLALPVVAPSSANAMRVLGALVGLNQGDAARSPWSRGIVAAGCTRCGRTAEELIQPLLPELAELAFAMHSSVEDFS